MPRELILHYGMHKTGTSSIQDSLAAHLDAPDTQYISLRQPNGSQVLGLAFDSTHLKRPMARAQARNAAETLPARRARARAELEEALETATADRVILSAEALFPFQPADLNEMLDVLLSRVERIHAVAYLREPRPYFDSAFQQILKRQMPPMLQKPKRVFYRRATDVLDARLGQENVSVWKFDPGALKGGDVVQDFCHRLEIPFDPAKVITTNESLSREAVQLLYVYRQANPAPRPRDARVVAALSGLQGGKFRLGLKLFEQMNNSRQEDLDWAAERTGQPFGIARDEAAGPEINSAGDLLDVPAAAIDWLAARTGRATADLRGRPEVIAGAVNELARAKGNGRGRAPDKRPGRGPGAVAAGRQTP